jgi:hypothetical protein
MRLPFCPCIPLTPGSQNSGAKRDLPLYLYAYPSPTSWLDIGSLNTFPRQRIHATVEELLDAVFPMRSA